MNNVNIIGNITKDIELKYTPNNQADTTVTLAVNEGYGDNQKTYFVDVQVWDKQAENLAKYCGKGSKIAVSGKLIQQSWEYEGKKQSKVLIQANNVMFLDTKKEVQASKEENKITPEEVEESKSDPFAEFNDEVQFTDDDIDKVFDNSLPF